MTAPYFPTSIRNLTRASKDEMTYFIVTTRPTLSCIKRGVKSMCDAPANLFHTLAISPEKIPADQPTEVVEKCDQNFFAKELTKRMDETEATLTDL